MRRADRLFRLVQILRGGRLWTADRLAEAMEVSVRTIYRDIADLQASGVPVDGEAGVGYIMREGFDLPPLMFTNEEIIALVLGARLVHAWGGETMQAGAQSALQKIEQLLPQSQAAREALQRLEAPAYSLSAEERALIDKLDGAASKRQRVELLYRGPEGDETNRRVRPLGLWFWGAKWTLVAWCELRNDFRMFRLDRIRHCETDGTTFEANSERDIQAFLRISAEREGHPWPYDPFLDR